MLSGQLRLPAPSYPALQSGHTAHPRQLAAITSANAKLCEMMRAMKGERIGEFEELTLLAVMTLGEGAYGVLVQEVIERETGREVTLGAVYAALERMERKGLLRSGWSESTGTRGGKPRRLFSVTAEGSADGRRRPAGARGAVERRARARSGAARECPAPPVARAVSGSAAHGGRRDELDADLAEIFERRAASRRARVCATTLSPRRAQFLHAAPARRRGWRSPNASATLRSIGDATLCSSTCARPLTRSAASRRSSPSRSLTLAVGLGAQFSAFGVVDRLLLAPPAARAGRRACVPPPHRPRRPASRPIPLVPDAVPVLPGPARCSRLASPRWRPTATSPRASDRARTRARRR